jgi:hypothetical protein
VKLGDACEKIRLRRKPEQDKKKLKFHFQFDVGQTTLTKIVVSKKNSVDECLVLLKKGCVLRELVILDPIGPKRCILRESIFQYNK